MRPLPITALACLVLTAPLHAQAIGPRPARAVWLSEPAAPRSLPVDTLDQHARATTAGQGEAIGTGIGILAGGLAAFYVSALSDTRSPLPLLAGVVIGGFAGAQIGRSASRTPAGPASAAPDSARAP